MLPGCDPEMDTMLKKLGWYIPRPDGKVDWRVFGTISSEGWKEFQEATSVISDLRPFLIDYMSLRENCRALEEIEPNVANDFENAPNVFAFGGVEVTLALAKAQNALSNFLSAASSFRDRACTRLRERFGSTSPEVKGFAEEITAAYDGSSVYRLLYNLRNYGVHHDSPLSLIPVRGVRQASDAVKFNVSLVLCPAEMLRSEKIQKSARAELGRQPDQIPLLPLAKEYFVLHGSLMKGIIDLHLPRLTEYQEYGRALLTKLAPPKGAMPMIWEGEDPRRQGHCHQFGFDEFAFLQQLHAQLSGPSNR